MAWSPWHIAGALFAMALATPAAAEDDVDLAAVVKVACAGVRDEKEERRVPLERIAEAILFQSGYPPSRLLGDTAVTREAYARLVIATVVSPPDSVDGPTRRTIGHYVLRLGQDIGPGSSVTAKARGLKVVSPFPADTSDRAWLFTQHDTVSVVCMPAKLPPQTVIAGLDAKTEVPRLGLVKKIEDLALEGADRKKADSATIGVKRERTEGDDGSSKTTTTLTFDGTFGLRVTGDAAITPVFAFANYSLARNRSKPAAMLGPDERADDKDTNGLALGVAADDIALPIPASLSGQVSFVSDYAKGSRRAVGGVWLTPGWQPTDLGFCGLGGLRTIELGKFAFRTMCVVQGELDYSHVFKVGRAKFKEHGDFLSAGVVVGIDLAPPLLEKSGVVGSFRYRYLPTISGRAPDINRIEAALKYRWWVAGATAFDFGFTYKRGEEFKTYTDEDALELSFGVIF